MLRSVSFFPDKPLSKLISFEVNDSGGYIVNNKFSTPDGDPLSLREAVIEKNLADGPILNLNKQLSLVLTWFSSHKLISFFGPSVVSSKFSSLKLPPMSLNTTSNFNFSLALYIFDFFELSGSYVQVYVVSFLSLALCFSLVSLAATQLASNLLTNNCFSPS